MKKIITNPALKSWVRLNTKLKNADEETCSKLLSEEKIGRARRQFIKRIHSRLNKVRADRERQDLGI
jgi:phosphopantothenate synthetase